METEWWVPLVGGIVTVLVAIITRGLYQAAAWISMKASFNDAEKEALQVLLEGMSLAQDEVVREAKAMSADGKLTKDEITRAQMLAISYAKKTAVGPAKDIVLSWSSRRAESLIKQLLSKMKGSPNVTITSDIGAGPEIPS
jgi:hypothetical protein